MSPLLRLATVRPQLLVDHAQAYADLLLLEGGQLSVRWRRQLLLGSLALCGGAVALVLAGVALMLWAALPPGSIHAPAWLVAVPALPLLAAIGCALALRSDDRAGPFAVLRQQLQADSAMLREALAE